MIMGCTRDNLRIYEKSVLAWRTFKNYPQLKIKSFLFFEKSADFVIEMGLLENILEEKI